MEPGMDIEAAEVDPAEVQQVVMEVLRALANKRRGSRAEAVMAPVEEAPPAAPPADDDAQMAELEEMLLDAPAEPKKPEDEDELE